MDLPTPPPSRQKERRNCKPFADRPKRNSALRKLGLTEDDIRCSETLFAQIPHFQLSGTLTKAEKILGYCNIRLKREKALKFLGVTEDEIDIENSKGLGALGLGGRRRSFRVQSMTEKRRIRRKSESIDFIKHVKHLGRDISSNYPNRRRSTGDILFDKKCLNLSKHTSGMNTTSISQESNIIQNLSHAVQACQYEILVLKEKIKELDKRMTEKENS